jgi:hypothetical protein
MPCTAQKGRQIATLRDDSFQAQLAGMLENKRAVLVIEGLVEPQPWLSTREGALKQRLPLDQWFAPNVVISVYSILVSPAGVSSCRGAGAK